MKLSPPLTVMAIAGIGLACTAWLKPQQGNVRPVVEVGLSESTVRKLALWAKGNPGADGRILSTAEAIEELVSHSPNRSPNAANSPR